MTNPEPDATDIEGEMPQLKTRIALVWARREKLKQALESGATPPRAGFQELENVDRELSELDARFKRLWDSINGTQRETP